MKIRTLQLCDLSVTATKFCLLVRIGRWCKCGTFYSVPPPILIPCPSSNVASSGYGSTHSCLWAVQHITRREICTLTVFGGDIEWLKILIALTKNCFTGITEYILKVNINKVLNCCMWPCCFSSLGKDPHRRKKQIFYISLTSCHWLGKQG
jgi:hypothetical protein